MQKPTTTAKRKNRGARPGLTRDESKMLTRTRLLAAAQVEFAEKGLEGANLRDILARANVSPGAFYYHFEDKSDLFLALLDEAAGELHRVMHDLRISEVGEHPIAWVESIFRQLLQFGKQRRDLLVMLYREAFSGNKKIVAFMERDQAAYIAEAEADYRYLIEKGQLPPIDARWAAYATVTLSTAALLQQLNSPADEDQWVKAMARFLLGGLPMMRGIS